MSEPTEFHEMISRVARAFSQLAFVPLASSTATIDLSRNVLSHAKVFIVIFRCCLECRDTKGRSALLKVIGEMVLRDYFF